MAKKSSNPADAFRKAQRAKELKKNKEARKKVREVQTVKRDTRDLENEIRSLKGKSDNASKSRIAELEQELDYVNKTKEAYVKDHPEAKDRVYGRPGRGAGGVGGGGDAAGEEEGEGSRMGKGKARLYDEQGRLKDPTRSVYYDPVYNPWGVPPPGMPYRERSPIPGAEGGSDEEENSNDDGSDDEDDSDDDIVMPQGPPPAGDDGSDDDTDASGDDDDIPLPDGPPPPKAAPPIPPTGPASWGGRAPPVPVPFHQQQQQQNLPYFPPQQPGFGPGYPPPPHLQHQQQQFQQPFFPPAGPSHAHAHARPMRPPRHNQQPSLVQDPLSDAPTQTYQGYRMAKADAAHAGLPSRPSTSDNSSPAGHSGLPPKPSSSTAPNTNPNDASSAPVSASAEISAAPVMRDLRKEATVFAPRALKRKGASASGGGAGGVGGNGGRINAAPNAGVVDEEGDEVVVRKVDSGLMGKLKGVLGSEGVSAQTAGSTTSAANGSAGKSGADEDYERFLAGLGDIS